MTSVVSIELLTLSIPLNKKPDCQRFQLLLRQPGYRPMSIGDPMSFAHVDFAQHEPFRNVAFYLYMQHLCQNKQKILFFNTLHSKNLQLPDTGLNLTAVDLLLHFILYMSFIYYVYLCLLKTYAFAPPFPHSLLRWTLFYNFALLYLHINKTCRIILTGLSFDLLNAVYFSNGSINPSGAALLRQRHYNFVFGACFLY